MKDFLRLHAACVLGSLEDAKAALHASSEPDAALTHRDALGLNAWHYAARSGRVELLLWLADVGADVAAVTTGAGLSALHLTAKLGHAPAVGWLLADARCRLRLSPALGAREPRGATALHFAASEGHVEVVVALADYLGPAAATLRDGDGRTVAELASRLGESGLAVVRSLRRLGLAPEPPERVRRRERALARQARHAQRGYGGGGGGGGLAARAAAQDARAVDFRVISAARDGDLATLEVGC